MRRTEENPQWLTATQAAKVIGISRQAVNLAIRDGRLAAQRVGPYNMIRRDVAEAFRKSAPEAA